MRLELRRCASVQRHGAAGVPHTPTRSRNAWLLPWVRLRSDPGPEAARNAPEYTFVPTEKRLTKPVAEPACGAGSARPAGGTTHASMAARHAGARVQRVARLKVHAAGRKGFTLLELLLALLLLVALLGAIGLAVGVQLRATDTSRSDVAQAQLARAILRQMADDLRGAIWYEPLDVSSALSGLSGVAGSAAVSSGVAGGAGMGSDPMAGGAVGMSSTAAPTEATSVVTDPSMYPAEPGLYGGSDWLEVDISRLPRTLPGVLGAADDLPSEVKTVAWYLAGGSSTAGQNAQTAAGEPAQGLMRRELDRAVTQWASESGQLSDLDRQAQLVAAEVVDLSFRYFDGATWVLQWDSASAGGLPWAVEISITLADAGTAAGGAGSATSSVNESTYRLVVALPLAEAALGETTSTSSTGEAAQPGSGSSGQSGSSGAAGSGAPPAGSGAGGAGSSGSGGAAGRGGAGGGTGRGGAAGGGFGAGIPGAGMGGS